MRKQLLSIFTIGMITLMPMSALAEYNYDADIPSINYTPIEQTNGYNTQYPLPVNSYQTQGYNYNHLQGNVVLVPANTTFSAVTTSTISSETTNLGDSVTMYLGSDFYYGKDLIASAGSKINGTVIQAKKGGYGNRNGQLQIRFTNIVTPTGQMIPISASIQTSDGSGVLKAGTAKDTTKEYVKDVGVGAGLGAALGTAMGALSSGRVGKGAIYGTALGGGLGLAKSIAERGGNVEIPQGSQLNIVLDQPVTVSSNSPF